MAPAHRDATRVLILDDDDDLRAIMVELLEAFDIPCEAVSSVAELKESLARFSGFMLAILDVNLEPGAPSGVDAYLWLRQSGFRGRIAFLTGHARTHPLVQQALALGDATVLEKPITSGELLQLVHA
jgi:CheY-like chemotaxis protein